MKDENGEIKDSADQRAQALIDRHPEVRLFWSANESGTESLVTALRRKFPGGGVRVWGTDVSPSIREMLHSPDGILQAVTGQDPLEMGKRATAAVLAALVGRRPPSRLEIVGDQLVPRAP